MKKDKTGVQLDLGHTSTDDFITEKYVLPLLRDEKMRNKLIEEHRACPVGKAAQPHKGQPMVEHSKELQIVLDKLRRQPMHIKKYVTICKKDFEDYRIGIVTGVRGQPVEISTGCGQPVEISKGWGQPVEISTGWGQPVEISTG